MSRKSDFLGTSKVIAATTAQTLTWTGTEIPYRGVIAYHFAMSDVGNIISDIDRIRVRSGGATIIDCARTHLQAWVQNIAKSNNGPQSAGQVLTIPLFDAMKPLREQQDVSQMPPDRQAQVEITTTAGTTAGTALLGWTITDAEPLMFPRFLSTQLNFPASTRNAQYSFAESGDIRGFTISTTGIDRLRFVVSGREATNAPGAQFAAVAFGDMFLEMNSLDSGTVFTSPTFHRVELGIPAAPGSSYVQLDTGAAWAGVANEMALYSMVPLAQGLREL